MHEFDRATEVRRTTAGGFATEVAEGWAIGGNPNGGYLLALALAAVHQEVGPPDPLSVTAHYLRPAELGPATVRVDTAKEGRRHATVTAAVTQDGHDRLLVLGTFGDLGETGRPAFARVPPPDLPAPDVCIPREATPAAAAAFPDMVRRFEHRLDPESGWARGVRRGEATIQGWIRFADGRQPDVWSLPLFADAFPPAVLEVADALWVPTLELTVHVRRRPAPGWLRARFRTRLLAGGYLDEDGELWDSDGELVAMSRQLAMLLPG